MFASNVRYLCNRILKMRASNQKDNGNNHGGLRTPNITYCSDCDVAIILIYQDE